MTALGCTPTGTVLATVFDPQTNADTPVLSEFLQMAALLIFLQLDVHHWLLRALVRSFAYLPPGGHPAGQQDTAAYLPPDYYGRDGLDDQARW